jgi:hypothetical protein
VSTVSSNKASCHNGFGASSIYARFRCCKTHYSTLVVWFGMASIRRDNYVVFVQHVGGSKAACIILVLQREPRFGKIHWFPAG